MNLQSLVSIYHVSASGSVLHWANGAVTNLGTLQGNINALPALHSLKPNWMSICTPFGTRSIHAPSEAANRPQIVYAVKASIEVLVSRLAPDYQTIDGIIGLLVFGD